jgi:hypothetical protein
VCPFCQRDKSADQKLVVASVILGLIGAGLGAAGGIAGAVVGMIIGIVIAGIIWRPKKTKPPEVKPVAVTAAAVSAATGGDTGRRLAELEDLRKAGMVSEAEYTTKRTAILEAL